ncbi:hypothetical protein VR41_10095 [Streptomyces sp. NRRL B-1568]|uniref:HTH marR-type domain-containing protein n=1 Tax=Streptomyces olivoverticillatus TaxID=66427 RepID=A0A7W7LRV2_9ACTN|nr:hypothetical protein [Streptomyces olivoverticillatus]KJY41930.1 hypothetical protein VR41_10095 [Streptomyces sp. NRRL B-1568]MBB4895283.1 hypothetical protein [Streptomyces olivoverticillatus]
MSKRQKGRRHRRVNRTPRPVGLSRPSAVRPEPRPEARPEPRAVVTAPERRPAPAPGLGRHEARTWDGLCAFGPGGASVDDLCASVGYQARTILKHVSGLEDHGLAERRGDRWYARHETEGALAGR